jgi:hypothetical protein
MASDDDKISEFVAGFLDEARVDYIGLWQVVGRVRRELKPRNIEQMKEFVLETVRRMLSWGFIAVDLASSGPGCNPWAVQEADEIIRRISAEWDVLGRVPTIGDIAWFSNPTVKIGRDREPIH